MSHMSKQESPGESPEKEVKKDNALYSTKIVETHSTTINPYKRRLTDTIIFSC
jgi:hypothetical protein